MTELVVRMREIHKSFDGIPVLLGVDFEVRRGEVHALVGSNGAGKSTLMKILQGVYTKDAGEVHAAGVGMVFQEFSLVPSLTVAQNIFLGAEKTTRLGLIDDRFSRRRAREIFADMRVAVDVDATLADLSTAYWQLTEIAKALARDVQVLIMDEPTASLASNEVAALFELVARLADRGVAIIYISHRMDEIYRIADRITILRDGRRLLTKPLADLSPAQIVEGIVGKEIESAPGPRDHLSPSQGDVLLEAVDLHAGARVNGVSFRLRAGEVLGIAGLMGSGRTELARCLFGIDRLDRGEVRLRGRVVDLRSPRAAHDAGIALIPEDRREQGLVLDHSVYENVLLPLLGKVQRGPFLDLRAGKRLVRTLINTLAVKVADPGRPIRQLSGGNQQKVVIAKWLGSDPDVLIMDEPTAGVDVGTKAEIVGMIRRLADSGRGVIVISSEFPELLAVSDRVLVIRAGSVVRELPRADIPDEESLQLAVQGV